MLASLTHDTWQTMTLHAVRKTLIAFAGCVFLAATATEAVAQSESPARSWRTAARHSAGMAPDPAALKNTNIVQVYAASTWGWRGNFAVHTWLIFKRAEDNAYTRYDVVGWRKPNVVQRNYGPPDGYWYGSAPQLLVDHRGPHVAQMIDEIETAIADYPYADTYKSYPGPNSNTFLAHIGRQVPALQLDLPANAIGKDYRPLYQPIGLSTSGTGIQASLLGLLGVTLGWEEGLELNLLGLHFGIDLNRPALRLPFIGRLGMSDTTYTRAMADAYQ